MKGTPLAIFGEMTDLGGAGQNLDYLEAGLAATGAPIVARSGGAASPSLDSNSITSLVTAKPTSPSL